MKALQLLGIGVLLSAVTGTPSAQAQTYAVLHSFAGYPADGQRPYAGVIRDSAGNLYGTTLDGGTSDLGVAYKLDTTGKVTVLHSFTGGTTDGAFPYAGVIRDSAGNLYGTTNSGGSSVTTGQCGPYGCGVVYKLDITGKVTVLHSFTGGTTDGVSPYAGVIRDSAGNLYGTTKNGGATNDGVVYKLDTTGKVTVLHSFRRLSTDGASPYAGVIRDSAGNLYGTTVYGGVSGQSGSGVVYKLDITGKETVLHRFAGGTTDGASPYAGVIRDSAGNLYGTTANGGTSGFGVVYKLDTTGKVTVLHSFTGGTTDGHYPNGGVVRDSAGNLYGTTEYGGPGCTGSPGCGVVYKLDTTGKETVLHSFTGMPTDGAYPFAGVIRDLAGNLYGTTYLGGTTGSGVVFELTR